MPSSAEELIKKCDKTLVFISPGIFGEIKVIRVPDTKPSVPTTSSSIPSGTSAPKSTSGVVAIDGPSRRASRSRIRKSPRNRKNIDYKKLSGEEAHEDIRSPPKKRRKNVNLRKPSSARIAAQRKIMDARLRSPPRPTRMTDPTPSTSAADSSMPKTVTRPANEDETREVITALLSLSQDQIDNMMETPVETTETENLLDTTVNIRPPIEANVINENLPDSKSDTIVKNQPEPAPEENQKIIGTVVKINREETDVKPNIRKNSRNERYCYIQILPVKERKEGSQTTMQSMPGAYS